MLIPIRRSSIPLTMQRANSDRPPHFTLERELLVKAFGSGADIGLLGGLIGLGGAEFRLPLLLNVFGFVALEAVILNKAMSLIVVASALVFRCIAVPFDAVWGHASVVLNLLGQPRGRMVGR